MSSSTSNTSYNTSTPNTSGTANAGAKAGEGIKGVFAKGHGIGEAIRGNINGAIDGLTGDKAAQAKNEQIVQGGQREFETGDFVKKGTTDKAL